MNQYARKGVVGLLRRGTSFLVIQRSAEVVAPLKWCFPGGGIQEGETEEAALKREFQEELGISILPQARICASVTPWNVHLSWWFVEATDDALQTLHPDSREVQAVRWMSLETLYRHPDALVSNLPILEQLMREEKIAFSGKHC
ncbi:MAG: NUDIX domain-containing protein [Planctomycetia bacterium]|nr:NUDIX domain-containing protein [Planctomycetia bacterium]